MIKVLNSKIDFMDRQSIAKAVEHFSKSSFSPLNCFAESKDRKFPADNR